MLYSNSDTILLYHLTPEERQAVNTANRHTNYSCCQASCAADLLAVPHLALVVNPTGLSETDWTDLMDYYHQAPEDGAKVFFTRPMLVPSDITAAFHFPEGVKDLQWQLTRHLYRHAVSSGDRWDNGRDARQALRNHAKQYPHIFFLCSPKNTDLLTDLQAVAKETCRLFLCTQKQSDTYRSIKLYQASRALLAAIHETGRVTFRFDFVPALIYGEDLLPLMEEKGFFMPIPPDRGSLSILRHFNNNHSLLLYPLEFSDAAADISHWWQGTYAWASVSFK